MVLAGHFFAGTVISQVCEDPNVTALIYVTAHMRAIMALAAQHH
ncbi:hypothetical protein [Sphingobium sp.]|nr:hypothetical protein [Sphingobium sp.]HUD93652.1 hypothetical protein [Sphingobium sp.]